jgi:hypothetical protein
MTDRDASSTYGNDINNGPVLEAPGSTQVDQNNKRKRGTQHQHGVQGKTSVNAVPNNNMAYKGKQA